MRYVSIPKKKFFSISPIFFSRPQLSHRLRLLPRATITVQFSLRCWPANHINPQSTAPRLLFPFLHTLQPGFKVYIADILFFDYLLLDQRRLWRDDQWHFINVSKATSDILEALEARQLNQSQIQMVSLPTGGFDFRGRQGASKILTSCRGHRGQN